MRALINDIKYAFRQLSKNPGFTFVAVLTLALGIGANTAIFSVLDRLLVRPLPVRAPHRLALLTQELRRGQREYVFNYPLFRDYQRLNPVFSDLCATAETSVGLGINTAVERQQALLVSGNYFRTLGVDAALGRTFAENEGVEIDDAPVIVLSHGLWRRQFGADPQVIGQLVFVNGKPFTIIGVAPREFAGTTRGHTPDLYVPLTMCGQLSQERPGGEHPLQTRYLTWVQILGRLKDGVTIDQAQAAMETLAQQIHAVTPVNTLTSVVVLPGAQGFGEEVHETRLPLYLLSAAAGLVLLIVCANLANLQLVRATARMRDSAVRAALGATRSRLMRVLLAESLLLSCLGGGLGVWVAIWLTGVLEHFRFAGWSFELAGGLDSRMLGFALATSMVTGIVFGLAPAWQVSHPQLVPMLKGSSGISDRRHRRWNLRDVLVVSQVGLSFLVLTGAGLCTRSLKKLERIDPGFEPSRVVLMSLDLGLNHYNKAQTRVFYDNLLERVHTIPGIEAAALVWDTPLSGGSPGMSIDRVDGYEKGPGERLAARFNVVSRDYFRTLSVPILCGREFDDTDTPTSRKTVVVDDTFAHRFLPGLNPLGRYVYLPGPDGMQAVEVVGVVGDMRNRRLADAPRPTMFFPVAQHAEGSLTLAVRTGLVPSATVPLLRDLVKSLDPRVPTFHIRTMGQQVAGSLALQRMAATLLSGLGALALLLATIGIYGVLAYAVSRRTHEIGIRMTLGAGNRDVLRSVVGRGLRLGLIGTGIGLAGAVVLTRVIASLLYNVSPMDPLTFACTALVLVAVAAFASYVPARRAARIDPMEALRYE